MAYDVILADRIRERLAELPVIEEKEMMGVAWHLWLMTKCAWVFTRMK